MTASPDPTVPSPKFHASDGMLPWAALEPSALNDTVSGAVPDAGAAVATAVGETCNAGVMPALILRSSPPGWTFVPVNSAVHVPDSGSEMMYDSVVAPATCVTSGALVPASISCPEGPTRVVSTVPPDHVAAIPTQPRPPALSPAWRLSDPG